MSLQQTISNRLNVIQNELNSIEKELSTLPEGKLSIYPGKNKQNCNLFHLVPDKTPGSRLQPSDQTEHSPRRRKTTKHKKVYLNRKKIDLASDLAYKTLLLARQRDLLKEKKGALSFLKACASADEEAKLLEAHPIIAALVRRRGQTPYNSLPQYLKDWQQAVYKSNPRHPEHLTVPSINGYFVRSKSEAIIDASLAKYNIPFRYECGIVIDGETYYPDFMIRHPDTGQTFLWEHFGMIDDPLYCRRNLPKIPQYAKMGYVPGKNLIITCETDNVPLDMNYVDDLIKYYFL